MIKSLLYLHVSTPQCLKNIDVKDKCTELHLTTSNPFIYYFINTFQTAYLHVFVDDITNNMKTAGQENNMY